eukprot:augustus_masked-scaffold_5-processed-gene-18.4-mRNA-1 protein AED:1.00 eAED:1.00 QI:0/-1/0/0/-1/1/1/0/145
MAETIDDKPVNEPKEKPEKKVSVTKLVPIPPKGAYAKLFGKNLTTGEPFEAYVTELPTTLGRETSGLQTSNFIAIGKETKISRKHAVITYDEEEKSFLIEHVGRNPLVVRKVQHLRQKPAKRIKIASKDPIRIADVGFYFLKALK